MKTEPIKLTFKSGSLWYGEYEVVNPEVIPITPDGYSTRIKDGDQITLPDGYGIETAAHHKWKEGTGMEFVRLVATITLPEKPENSAHGYTEGADYIPTDCAGDRIPTITTVEPSESQEETMAELHLKGCELAHSEGKKEGWNEAIASIQVILRTGRGVDIQWKSWFNDELQKLRK